MRKRFEGRRKKIELKQLSEERHYAKGTRSRRFYCPVCPQSFNYEENYKQHYKEVHAKGAY